MKTILFVLALGTLLLSCAMPVRQGPPAMEPRHPASYALDLRFSSEVPDEYFVFSGTPESYNRYRVNDRLRFALEEYARRKSAQGGAEPAVIRFRLIAVKTGFFRIHGYVGPARGTSFSSPEIRNADGPEWPKPFVKRVSLTAAVELLLQGKVVRDERFTVEAEATFRPHEIDHWSYDYSDVLHAAMSRAVEALDRIVNEAWGAPSKA